MKSVKEVITIWLVRLPLWQYPTVGREVSVSWSWVVKKQIKKVQNFLSVVFETLCGGVYIHSKEIFQK